MNRERRQWTAQEDELLRMAVNREEPGNPAPSKWHAIAQHVPERTNKDCRKRWYAKMSSDVLKGGWSPDEDQRLLSAIDAFGTRWSLVAGMVQTRNSDQCAKRWCDTLNPAIDRTAWSAEADEILIQAVNEHGKVWTKIVQMYFPGRTGLAAKNRYNSITRSEGSSREFSNRRPSRSPSNDPDAEPYYRNPPSRGSTSGSMPHPEHRRWSHPSAYSSIPHPGGNSMSFFDNGSRTHTPAQQFQASNHPMPPASLSQSSAYYSVSDGSYPSSSQYQAPTLPGNDLAFNDLSLPGQVPYPNQMQYPNPTFTSGYGSVYQPDGFHSQATPGQGRAADPRAWGSF